MPMDIRAYFGKKSESKSVVNPSEISGKKAKKNRKRVFIDSDSDGESPTKKASIKKSKTEGNNKSSSIEISKNDISNFLGKAPVKRVEQPKAKKKESCIIAKEWDIESDDDFLSAETYAQISQDISCLHEASSVTSPKIIPLHVSDDTNKVQTSLHLNEMSPTPKKIISQDLEDGKISSSVISNPKTYITKHHEMSPSPERDIEPSSLNCTSSTVVKKKSPKNQEIKKHSPKKNVVSCPTFKNLKMNNAQPMDKNGSTLTESSNTDETQKTKKVKVESKILPFTRQNHEEDPVFKLWVDKYKPSNVKQIIGQQGEKSNVNKLIKWLRNWFSNHSGDKKHQKPSPWAKDDSGTYFKAALLSGPPGIGKTTTAHLVCRELDMDVVEFNASDTRSKKLLQEEIRELLSSKSLLSYATDGSKLSSKHVLVMDEVDGMAGNEDRGGVQELIQLIKSTRIPIICMCNDRNHPKIRSLANYCFDLRFNKPRAEQIKGAMMSVCFKEGLKIKPDVLNEIISSTNQDIRLTLNHLSVLAAQSALNMPINEKYVKIGAWDVLRKVFSESEHKNMSIYDKCDLFFFDYNIAPLFVQENYLSVQPHSAISKTKCGAMELFAKAAQSIAQGDIVERTIRSHNAWNLLPVQAVYSSFIPGEYLVGHVGGQINFPSWLGKNSKRGKIDRLNQEIQAHTRLKISGSKEAVNLDYAYAMRENVFRPLLDKLGDGISESLAFLKEYSLLREDLESLNEITMWPTNVDPFSKIESKVKAAFTRAYNKDPVVTSFCIQGQFKKGRGGGGNSDELDMGDENLEEADDNDEEDNQGVDKDAMIKVKKRKNDENKTEESNSSKRRCSVSRGKRGKK